VTVFVDDKHVFVLEAGGPKAQVERFEPQIEWAIRNFRAK
jgi:hypothetical protein